MSLKKFLSAAIGVTDNNGAKTLVGSANVDRSMAKSLTWSIAVEGVDSDTRLVLGLWAGPNPEHLVVQTDLYDSGGTNGVKRGTVNPSAVTDVSRFGAARVELYLQKVDAGSGQKSGSFSAWVDVKPF
jgi:hypothetical protein